jgi:hypothetical protein
VSQWGGWAPLLRLLDHLLLALEPRTTPLGSHLAGKMLKGLRMCVTKVVEERARPTEPRVRLAWLDRLRVRLRRESGS